MDRAIISGRDLNSSVSETSALLLADLRGVKGVTTEQSAFKGRDVDIADADKTFGWWQKKQFADLGIQKIHLLPSSVALDLKGKTEKYNLGLDKRVSFDFAGSGNSWTLTNVTGLSLKGTPITKIESTASKITFYTGSKANEYGSSVNDYIKALFDPLMRADLRK